MLRDNHFRRLLWLSAAFNVGGAALFAFPASALGQFAGLPPEVPLIYRGCVTLFVLLFAGLYGWLAMQPTLHRPMIAFAAIGKASAFALVALLWLLGAAKTQGLMALAGDLVLALLYLAWLRRSR